MPQTNTYRIKLPRTAYQENREKALGIVSRGETEDVLLIAMVIYARRLERALERAVTAATEVEKEITNL